MYPIKFTFIIILLFLFTPICTAKKRCKPLLEKLQTIQALQRNGYSVKRGNSLRAKEDKARDKWWQCETGRSKKTNNKKKGYSKNANNRFEMNKKIKEKSKMLTAGIPFATNNAVVIKSKYQGKKKRAWLIYYQQPERCQRPKNLSIFAFCSENKQTQRSEFEQQYSQHSD
jgi:hypothetical protein